MSGPSTAPLGARESHDVLVAAARRCVADTERDLALADSRRDHRAALDLAAQLDAFTRLHAALEAGAAARPGMAA